MELDPYSEFIAKDVYPTMSKISLCLAPLVVLTMIVISIYDRKLVDRVSLRLQTAIALYDIWLHSLPLWSRPYNNSESSLCGFISFQLIVFPLFYSFINVAVGVNLQLIFLHGFKMAKKIEMTYWLVSLGLSLLIFLIPLISGKIGYGAFNKCFITGEDETYARVFDFIALELIMIACMVYLLVIVILVVIKLNKETEIIRNYRLFRGTNASKRAVNSVKMMGLRAIMYPIVMVITHSGLVVSQIVYDLAGIIDNSLGNWSYIGGGILGTLNFIAFFSDPTVHSAFKKIYLRVSTRSLYRNAGSSQQQTKTTDSQMTILPITNTFQENANTNTNTNDDTDNNTNNDTNITELIEVVDVNGEVIINEILRSI